ncbi:signal-regulatory protein beta-2-like [Melanotaenia boesemani]|uniref:signal-regulatory protein beta-2-like n=1 Tax=Melanotaenia boesemani TaxID=1250792 RepID=UPI001C05E20F|nr:signal-regulatory protein beta-2-like [Melanotaenia boesemani]
MMVVFVNVFLLWSLCVAESREISQPVSVETLKLGDSATIRCYIKSILKIRVWYKLTMGRKLQLVATMEPNYNRSVLADEFQQRFSVKFDNINSHLSISTTSWDDVGTYFCGVMHLNDVRFGSGTFLMLKGVKMISDSVVQQPESESVQSGDSVTLSCSVRSDHCSAENTDVVWLKNSEKSAPEMIYSSEDQNRSCQRTESGQTTCVSNLLMKEISSEDAGTYHCVVTSCGRILFGNGTTIINTDSGPLVLSQTVLVLMLSNIILGTVTVLLMWMLYKTQRKNSTAGGRPCDVNQPSDAVTYAAVCSANRNLVPRPARLKYSGESVVYSDIRSCQQSQELPSWD